jgi:hypothetical protein
MPSGCRGGPCGLGCVLRVAVEGSVTLFATKASQRQRSNDVRVTMMKAVLIVSSASYDKRQLRIE